MAEVPERELDVTLGELARRLRRVEEWTGHFEEKTARQMDTLQASIASLAYVSRDLYQSERQATDRRIEETHRLAMWALATVVSVTIGAIVTGILAASGIFK